MGKGAEAAGSHEREQKVASNPHPVCIAPAARQTPTTRPRTLHNLLFRKKNKSKDILAINLEPPWAQ